MKRVILLTSLLLPTLAPAQAAKLNTADCEALWNNTRPKGSDLNAELAKPFVTDFKAVDTDGNNHISSGEFYAGCEKDLVHAPSGSSTSTPAAPKK